MNPRVFTPARDVRTDDGDTGQWPAVTDDAPSATHRSDDTPIDGPLQPTTHDQVDFDARFIEQATLAERDGERVVVAMDALSDAVEPEVLLQRWQRTSLAETEAVVRRVQRRAAVRHPALEPIVGLVLSPETVGVLHAHRCAARLDEWVAEDGPLPADEALGLVQQLAGAVAALREAGVGGVGLTAARVGLIWDTPDGRPRGTVCELAPLDSPADEVAALATLLAHAITGKAGGRPRPRSIRAFVELCADPHAAARPASIEAFAVALDGLRTPEKRRSGVLIALAAVTLVGAGAAAWFGYYAPLLHPPAETRPVLQVGLTAATDPQPPPPPRTDEKPLGEAYRTERAKLDVRLAKWLGKRRPSWTEGRLMLETLAEALDGRTPTRADRETVASIASHPGWTRAWADSADRVEVALAEGQAQALRDALVARYALDPTHTGGAFAHRHQTLFIVAEEK